ncbi:hypothetical protein BTVI_143696 [Pitangus sulphuratus]|nr:hypothetical protein BTVI_143696 [Pitangus sulphuratus]
MSSTWTCAKHWTLSHVTSSAPNCRDTDLMDGQLGGQGIVWAFALQESQSMLDVQVGASDKWQLLPPTLFHMLVGNRGGGTEGTLGHLAAGSKVCGAVTRWRGGMYPEGPGQPGFTNHTGGLSR